MPGKFTREAKFFGFDGITKIRLYANQGKNGYNLGTTMKSPNERATTGMQVTFQSEEEANKEFDRRVEDTVKKGYAPRGSGNGMIGRRSRFADLPTEPEWGKVTGTPIADRVPLAVTKPTVQTPSIAERMGMRPPATQAEVQQRVEEAQTHQEQPEQLREYQDAVREEIRETGSSDPDQSSGEAGPSTVEEAEHVMAHEGRGTKGSRRNR